ncbi:putative tetrahydrocannabinolic acid synthase [Helianthus anomalus]
MSKTFPELGLKKEDCFEVSWIQSVLYWANFDFNQTKPELLLDRHTDIVKFLNRKADYVQTPIPKAGLTAILNKLIELGDVGLVFNPYGGRMNEVPANATPMPHRAGNLYKIQYSLNWEENDPKATEKNVNQCKDIVNSGDGFNSGKIYGEKYFKGNFERLVKVKTSIDPDNFFRNEQSIPTQNKNTKGMSS